MLGSQPIEVPPVALGSGMQPLELLPADELPPALVLPDEALELPELLLLVIPEEVPSLAPVEVVPLLTELLIGLPLLPTPLDEALSELLDALLLFVASLDEWPLDVDEVPADVPEVSVELLALPLEPLWLGEPFDPPEASVRAHSHIPAQEHPRSQSTTSGAVRDQQCQRREARTATARPPGLHVEPSAARTDGHAPTIGAAANAVGWGAALV